MTDSPDTSELLTLIRKRRSCRRFDPKKSVSDEQIKQCLEAARLAPSACNRQPWRFIIVRDATKRADLCHNGLLPGIRHEWLEKAPVIIALCVEKELLTHRIAPTVSGVQYHMLDAGIAGEHFVLAATELGLATCWIGWFKEKAVKKILEIPRQPQVASLIALGYAAESATGESTGSRPRSNLSQIAFADTYHRPLQ